MHRRMWGLWLSPLVLPARKLRHRKVNGPRYITFSASSWMVLFPHCPSFELCMDGRKCPFVTSKPGKLASRPWEWVPSPWRSAVSRPLEQDTQRLWVGPTRVAETELGLEVKRPSSVVWLCRLGWGSLLILHHSLREVSRIHLGNLALSPPHPQHLQWSPAVWLTSTAGGACKPAVWSIHKHSTFTEWK